MRILVLGAGGRHRTERSIVRAARELGHPAAAMDAPWHERGGRLGLRLAAWRVERFAPEFVICTRHAMALGPDRLRRLLHGRGSAFWYFDAVSPLPAEARALAAITGTTFATYGFQTESFRALGASARFLPQGADPATDYPASAVPSGWRPEVSFVGSGQYPRRHAILAAIAQRFSLQVRGPGWEPAPSGIPVAGGPVRGRQFRAAVTGAAISLGIHALDVQTTERRGGTSNRLWRVLGCGGCYLAEHAGGVDEFAQGDRHAVWYRTPDEAIDLIRELLADPGLRARIAEAGRRHVLERHTYRHRLPLLLAGRDYSST